MYSLPMMWPEYTAYFHPYITPYLLPIAQISLMSSVYCTVVMSFERYVRICLMSNFIDASCYFTSKKFKIYVAAIILFPVAFYFPKFFEVSCEVDDLPEKRTLRYFYFIFHFR